MMELCCSGNGGLRTRLTPRRLTNRLILQNVCQAICGRSLAAISWWRLSGSSVISHSWEVAEEAADLFGLVMLVLGGGCGIIRGMLGSERLDRQLLDTMSVCGDLVPEGSVYRFLAEYRARVFPDGMFEDLFGSRGRPSTPGSVVATVMVLQALEGLSDREAIGRLRCDIRWKAAAGLSLTDEGFHPTVLTLWRARLRRSEAPERMGSGVPMPDGRSGLCRRLGALPSLVGGGPYNGMRIPSVMRRPSHCRGLPPVDRGDIWWRTVSSFKCSPTPRRSGGA